MKTPDEGYRITPSSNMFVLLAVCCLLSPHPSPAFAAGTTTEAALAPGPAPAAETAKAEGSGTISGKVTLEGTAPPMGKIQMAADPVCLQQHTAPVLSEEVLVNEGALQNVLVYVKGGLSGKGSQAPTTPVVIDQVGCRYHPHVFGIQVGQPLEIRNSDSTLHNINAQPKLNKRFNIAQPVKGMKTVKTFDKPEVGVPFKCNVHPWMGAYASVFDHPFFGVTDANGAFTLTGLPAGTYTVEAWHEKYGALSQSVTIADQETKSLTFSFKAT
jgi:plastocyanin